MGSEWLVTTEKLEGSANLIDEKTGSYNTEWEKLYSEVQNMKSSQWQGSASDTFNSKLEEYRNDFQEMATVLQEYAESLRTIATNYKNAEDALKDAASNLYTGN